jgi:hypothetical protein
MVLLCKAEEGWIQPGENGLVMTMWLDFSLSPFCWMSLYDMQPEQPYSTDLVQKDSKGSLSHTKAL